MARQSSFKKGGGFLNGVDAVITGYEFTDGFAGKPYVAGKMTDLKGKSVDKPHSLNVLLSVRVDGATEDTTATLRVAKNFDEWDVSDEGHTLTPNEDAALGGSSAWGKFIQSWEAAASQGAESEEYAEGVYNYEPIIGSRVRLVQQAYSAQELANIKKLGAPEKRKGTDGKDYARQSLVVEEVYELAQPATKSNGKAAKPAAKSAVKAVATKGKTATAPVDEIKEKAAETLLAILEANGGSIGVKAAGMKVLLTIKGQPELRDSVRAFLSKPENLTALQEDGFIVYNTAKQLIEAVA